jgi:hypothetical protein
MSSIGTLTKEIVRLAGSIAAGTRRLKAERIKAGKLLIRLRACFGRRNSTGGYRGSRLGTFCSYLKANGINVSSAYSWIAEASGKNGDRHVVRNTLSRILSRLGRATSTARKLVALRSAVRFLVKEYEIPAEVVVKEK